MPWNARVSLQEEPLKDDLADEGVISDLYAGFLANIEEVGFEVVAAPGESFEPSPEGVGHLTGRFVG